jgi:hypothetical protein
MRKEEVQGWTVLVSSFLLGDHWHATVENTEAGARIARGNGATRAEAEGIALRKAKERLAATRVFRTDTA